MTHVFACTFLHFVSTVVERARRYRGTSLIRSPPPVGPYSSTMPRAFLCFGGGRGSQQRGTSVNSTASEQEKNNLKGFMDFHLHNGKRKGRNLALTVLIVPFSLNSRAGWCGAYQARPELRPSSLLLRVSTMILVLDFGFCSQKPTTCVMCNGHGDSCDPLAHSTLILLRSEFEV